MKTIITLATGIAAVGIGMACSKEQPPAVKPAVESKPEVKPAASAEMFAVDGVHSSVVFKIKHMDVTNFYGRFDKVSGSFNLMGNPGDMKLDVAVDADSVNTNNAGRDKHVKSSDFFSAQEFPTITFKSTSIKRGTGEHMFDVAGDLTFRGVTKPITATVEHTGSGPGGRGGTVAGLEARFTIKRSDFGNPPKSGLSDQVDLIVSLEGGKK